MIVRIVPLAAQHDRRDFDCGEPALNSFLQRLARQQSERDFNRTYVAEMLGEPRIGRLAVDQRCQGTGVGVALLQHAMDLAEMLAQQIGLYALFVEAKNETAAAFYVHFGFQRMPDRPLDLFLTTDVIRRARAAATQH